MAQLHNLLIQLYALGGIQSLACPLDHFIPALTVNDIETIENDENLALYQAPSYTIHYVCFNKNNAPWNIKEVRQAINYAINKQDLLDGALNGIGTIANAPLNSLHLGYNDSIPFNEYDLDAAKAKMVEKKT